MNIFSLQIQYSPSDAFSTYLTILIVLLVLEGVQNHEMINISENTFFLLKSTHNIIIKSAITITEKYDKHDQIKFLTAIFIVFMSSFKNNKNSKCTRDFPKKHKYINQFSIYVFKNKKD